MRPLIADVAWQNSPVLRIGVVGDYVATNETHQATGAALGHAAEALGHRVAVTWVPTPSLRSADAAPHALAGFGGLVIAPGSPYRDMRGALAAIAFAREHDVPVLGTCGGFQHMVIEYARNVLGVDDAAHAEYDPYASRLFVTPLSCSLAGQRMEVALRPGTTVARAYGATRTTERYYCNFGLNPEHRGALEGGGLRVSGVDGDGEVRVVEIPGLRFFMGTLFVPQASSRPGHPHPLLRALVASASEQGAERLVIAPDDPRAGDVAALLARHLAFSREVTPPGHVHALGTEELADPTVTFYGARRGGRLVGVGALRHLDGAHGEIKSMHTAEGARRQGVGRAMVEHLIAEATARGYRRVSLETGTVAAFASARALYARAGFVPCAPFGEYTANPHSICMTLPLADGRTDQASR
ncbi:MAG: CTP synthase C-terminal region-related (seleno)protein [Acidimicrobiales bacterium]